MKKKFANVKIVYTCDDGDNDLSITHYIRAKVRALRFWRWIDNPSQWEFTLASEYGSLCFDVFSDTRYPKGFQKIYRSTFLYDRFTSGPIIMELRSALTDDPRFEVSVVDEKIEW